MPEITLGQTVVVTGQAPTARPGSGSGPQPKIQPASLREVRAMADFPVRQPSYLPSAGLALAGVGMRVGSDSGQTRVLRVLSKFRESASQWLTLQQSPLPGTPARLLIPDGLDLRAGRVGDYPAAFYTLRVSASDMPGGHVSITHGLWEADGCLLILAAPATSSEELSRVGSSLV